MQGESLLLERLYASSWSYSVFLFVWTNAVNTFFREIRPRGAVNIPRSGPVIFVAAPHHNQAWCSVHPIPHSHRLSSS
jgi:1-acyl-sn-glycerol-3-phosphate acyltransferase